MPSRFFALIFLILPNISFAIDQLYNWNGLEFRRAGNVHIVQPSSPESTKLRGGWALDISDVEPKSTATHNYPLKHSSNPPAKLSVNWPIDTKKVSHAAAKAAKAGAAGAATGSPYLTVASIACAFVCDPLVDLLLDSGLTVPTAQSLLLFQTLKRLYLMVISTALVRPLMNLLVVSFILILPTKHCSIFCVVAYLIFII